MGTVGEALFHERRLGILLFAAQTLSAFLGLCLTAGKRRAFLAETKREREKKTATPPFTVLTSSIAETAGAMLSVCGFIVFFSLCTEALSDALALVGLSRFAFLRALAGGLLEISAGFLALSETDISADAIAVLGGFFLGFGGISVFGVQLVLFSHDGGAGADAHVADGHVALHDEVLGVVAALSAERAEHFSVFAHTTSPRWQPRRGGW
jgi:hypothetical protein